MRITVCVPVQARVQWHEVFRLFEMVRWRDPNDRRALVEVGRWYRGHGTDERRSLLGALVHIEAYIGPTALLSAWLRGQAQEDDAFDARAWYENRDNVHYARAVLVLQPRELDEEDCLRTAAR